MSDDKKSLSSRINLFLALLLVCLVLLFIETPESNTKYENKLPLELPDLNFESTKEVSNYNQNHMPL